MWVSCDLCSQSSHLLRFLSAVAPRTRQRVYRIKQDSAARQQLLKSRKNQMLILPIQARARKPGKNHGADIIRFLFRGAKRFPLTGGNLPRPTPHAHAPTGRFSELVEETRFAISDPVLKKSTGRTVSRTKNDARRSPRSG